MLEINSFNPKSSFIIFFTFSSSVIKTGIFINSSKKWKYASYVEFFSTEEYPEIIGPYNKIGCAVISIIEKEK